jgi:hypothetical protein
MGKQRAWIRPAKVPRFDTILSVQQAGNEGRKASVDTVYQIIYAIEIGKTQPKKAFNQ